MIFFCNFASYFEYLYNVKHFNIRYQLLKNCTIDLKGLKQSQIYFKNVLKSYIILFLLLNVLKSFLL